MSDTITINIAWKNMLIIGLVLLIFIAGLELSFGSPSPPPTAPAQLFGCVFDTVSKTGCQTQFCTVKQSYLGPTTGPDIDCVVTFPKPFAVAPTTIMLNWANEGQIHCPYICSGVGFSGNGFGTNQEFMFVSPSTTAASWPAMPAALTEIFGTTWHEGLFDPSGQEQTCLVANVVTPGTATAILKAQYALPSNPTVFADLLPGADLSIATAGFVFSCLAATSMPLGAMTGNLGGVIVRVVGSGGNGVVSPSFGNTFLYGFKGTLTDLHFGYNPASVTTTGFTIDALSPVTFADNSTAMNQLSWTFHWTAMS